MKEKIKLTDSMPEVMLKMSEGNPGALSVCMQVLTQGEKIDPDNMLKGLGVILSMDTLGLYGTAIWMLYKDVCQQNLRHMLAVLRGNQLGIVSKAQVMHAVQNRGEGLEVADVCQKVKERLPNFQLEEAMPA